MRRDETNDPTDNGWADLERDLIDQGVAFGGSAKPRKPDPYMRYLYDQRTREKIGLPRITFTEWQKEWVHDYDGQ